MLKEALRAFRARMLAPMAPVVDEVRELHVSHGAIAAAPGKTGSAYPARVESHWVLSRTRSFRSIRSGVRMESSSG